MSNENIWAIVQHLVDDINNGTKRTASIKRQRKEVMQWIKDDYMLELCGYKVKLGEKDGKIYIIEIFDRE